MENAYIELKNVSKHYGSIKALDNLSFSINKGEVFGYIGPNGAGKTTTIKILVGLIRNYKGKVYIDGVDISKSRADYSKTLGYLPQEVGFQEWRTVDHALKTFGKLSGLKSKYLEKRIEDALKLVSLTEAQYKKIKYLSGGMKQRLCFAQAILNEPKILILDEPMSGLDPTSRFQMKNIIKEFAKTGITILLSSHILSDVQDFCTKIGILNNGYILKIGSPIDLQQESQIQNNLEIVFAEKPLIYEDLTELSCIDSLERLSDNKLLVFIKSETDLDESIYFILKKIVEKKSKVRSFHILKPSLEDVYIKYIRGGV